MSSHRLLLALSLLLFFTLSLSSKHDKQVLESGYTVTTVIDGHERNINPHLLLPRPGSSDLILLDSSRSVFYTLSFPISPETEAKLLAGQIGVEGYSDGELGSAVFMRPKSFAVDLKGNVYVADRTQNVIRKITNSGVTTIAGGYSVSEKPGTRNGPAQNATFSPDIDLVFVPQLCALLISDRGNQLVRKIDLRPQDCAAHSPSGLGSVSVWIVGLLLSCLIGLIVGFAIRPYVFPYEGSISLRLHETWKHCLVNLGKAVLILCSVIRSAVASFTLYTLLTRIFLLALSHLSLVFSVNFRSARSQRSNKDFVSLMDSDVNNHKVDRSPLVVMHELKDLISSSNDCLQLSNPTNEIPEQGESSKEGGDALLDGNGRIDEMIRANFEEFAKEGKETRPLDDEFSVGSFGLVKRR